MRLADPLMKYSKPGWFPIPMRGNEVEILADGVKGIAVPNPHEG